MCLDKGHSCSEVEELPKQFRYTARIRARGGELQMTQEACQQARRWVVERTHRWMTRFQRILIPWDKKLANYPGSLQFAFSLIVYRAGRIAR